MKKIIVTLMVLMFVQGCSSLQLTRNSDHGVIMFSTSLISGCDEDSYFDNGALYVENRPTADTSFNIPIGHVGSGIPFLVKSMFFSADFGKTGKVHVKQINPGTYYFTKMHATPISFVHHETEPLRLKFNVKPGSIHYLGSIALGTIECASPKVTPNIGKRTILKITNESIRDTKIAQKEWEDMPSDLIINTWPSAR